MEISAINTSQYSAVRGNDRFAKVKQSFQDLGSALESGDLSAAKDALTELQKNAPAQAKNDKNNPMSAKMDALSKAIDSGDVKAAQDAYADIKETMSQRPAGGMRMGSGAAHSGAAPGGASKSSSSNSSSDSNKTYDTKDANKDGEVSWKEEQDYYQKHPEKAAQASSSAKVDSYRGVIDALA
jgi:hypothetical protein